MEIIKRSFFTLIFIFTLQTVSAQMIGAGIQVAESEKIQFAANIHTPYCAIRGNINFFIVGEVDYTGGSTKLSGLNIKPVSPTIDLANLIFGDNADKGLFWISSDIGYLRNFSKGDCNGVVITPNITCVYSLFYIKSGYDMNVSKGNNQFFIRLGAVIAI